MSGGNKRGKPTRLKAIEGNLGKRELPTDEPQPRPTAPQKPDDLDELASASWDGLAPVLSKLGLLTEADGVSFEALCRIRGRLAEVARWKNSEDGTLISVKRTVDGAGQEHFELKQHPMIVLERQLLALLRPYAAEFGLSPRGRVGLSVGNSEQEVDDMSRLLSK